MNGEVEDLITELINEVLDSDVDVVRYNVSELNVDGVGKLYLGIAVSTDYFNQLVCFKDKNKGAGK